jgi:hypothetical protein
MPKIPTRESDALDYVLAYMRRHHLRPDDLTAYDDKDLRDSDPIIRATAGAVSRCWGHMARLRVTVDEITVAWRTGAAA